MGESCYNSFSTILSMAKILDGRIIREEIAQRLSAQFSGASPKPTLAIIQVGARQDSTAYITQKKKFGERVGALVRHITFPETVKEEEIRSQIVKLNNDSEVNGIILQIPLPKNLNAHQLIESISTEKDVDGLTSTNLKKLLLSDASGIIPATAFGIIKLLDYYEIPIARKKATVVGRSLLVGKSTALCLLNRDASVTICHSKTENLSEITKQADILVIAAGRPALIGAEHVSAGQAVIDVGINLPAGGSLQEEIAGEKFIGDVDFKTVQDIVAAISPVPGGVGPMTVASLFENLFKVFDYQRG